MDDQTLQVALKEDGSCRLVFENWDPVALLCATLKSRSIDYFEPPLVPLVCLDWAMFGPSDFVGQQFPLALTTGYESCIPVVSRGFQSTPTPHPAVPVLEL